MTLPAASLPPPTATELAAVRARVDGRTVLGRKGSLRRGRIAALAVTVLVAILISGLATLRVAAGDRAWNGAAFGVFAVVVVGTGVVLRAAGRGVDGRVRRRLAAEAVPTAPRPGAWRRFGLDVLPAALNAACLAGAVALAASRAATAATTAALVVLAGTLTLLAGYAAVLLDVVLAPVVGSGPVLEAIDAALARRDLRPVALSPVFALMFFAVASSRPPGPLAEWAYGAAVVVLLVVFGVALRTTAADRALLEDHRLPSAPPPQVWLGGSPA